MNVSGRGMSVRATHLPELEAPVVVRFQDHGAEVIAEAVVVWRRTTEAGSEFGVRFTALDSSSVQALKALCQSEPFPMAGSPGDDEPDEEYDTEPAPAAAVRGTTLSPPPASSAPRSAPSSAPRSAPASAPSAPASSARLASASPVSVPPASMQGASVRLHIEGMAAPMQARVRQQGSGQVALTSPLEFLRVGRDVDIEEDAPGGRRRARIDRVDVDVDPDSQVPELVVSLCYESTSSPPRVQAAPSSTGRPHAHGALATDDDEEGDDLAPDGERESPALKATVRSLGVRPPPPSARESEGRVRHAGPSLEVDTDADAEGPSDAERLRERLDGVLDELSKAARVARQRAVHVGAAATRGARWLADRAENARLRAIAAQRALPVRRTASAPRSLRPIALRSQNPSASDTPPRRVPPRLALAAGAIVISAAAATWIGRTTTEAQPKSRTPAALAPAASPATERTSPIIIEEEPTAPRERPRLLVPADDGEPADVAEPAGVVAQVPLFGPTSLDPAPGPSAAPGTRRAAPERRALARAEANTGFEAPAPSSRPKTKPGAEFTSGRLRLPTVHRLRLDEPGTTLRGERTPTGFDVIIPGRKTMESGTAIAKRDARIAKVSTKNGSDGARVSFRFRSDIPAYKVRLRNDFVEIFISE